MPREAPPSPPEILSRAEEIERVARCALQLDEPYRTTILLRFIEGLPPRAVAKRLDVPVETVRTHIQRGLARLRARLDEEHHGDRRAWVLVVAPWALPRRPRPVSAPSPEESS